MRRSLTLVSATWLFVSMIPFPCQLLAQGKGATSPQVGAVYHTCFRHPSRHFQTKSGQDALTLHFKNPKQVDGQSVAWHTSQLDQMMTASLDFIAFAWPMNDATDQKEALQSLKALIEARTAITKAGGAPPTIALFLETSPHADLDRRADRLDLREETGRDQLISQIMGAFAVITKDHRATIDGFLPIFVGPANGTPHSKDIFSHLLFFLKMKLKASPYFVVERSWQAEVQASWTDGAPIHGPANDTPIAFIGPGFDNQALPMSGGPIRHREETRFYQHSFDALLLRRLSLVVIDSWNQFHNGTGIAPSVECGDEYLEITHRYVHLLKAGALPDIKNPVRLAHPSPLSRPDRGWWSPGDVGASVSFNPAVQPGNRGNGVRLVPTPDSPFKRVMDSDSASIRSAGMGANTTYLYFGIADEFAHNTARCVEITIDFIDGGAGSLRLQYDSWRINERQKGAYSSTPRHSRSGLLRRRKARFILPEARFGNRQTGGADFRIEVRGPDLSVLRVSAAYASGKPPRNARVIVE